ncbi:MAG: tRNA (adenosine(37)-N6)-dimethylallyltransferase MiaA [Lachnospiraceae bacterium]|nr:tRNA (adenosine(37)-N6)-dimethylallyltransferase MiaA [Lachnospiraceae bacterium]
MKKPLVVLTGPTAVGKTDLSIMLAKKINGEIISADSMQVYKYMDIGSAKIMPDEMQGVKHYLVDELYPDEEFNIYRFKQMADGALEQIYANGHIPIVTGGTGFYIQALLYDIDFTENEADTGYRQQLEKLALEKGAEYLHSMLMQCDTEAAAAIHPNNTKRVVRALEYYRLTGQKISEHNETEKSKESPYNFAYVVLNRERKVLYERIEKRIDIMLKKGLVDEVKRLKDMGYTRDMVSMQGLGYKEILDYLNGQITLDEAEYILKRDTRHFAKRQLTWFRREKDVCWFDMDDKTDEQILNEILEILAKKNIIDNNLPVNA